jgi:hypothetical protein
LSDAGVDPAVSFTTCECHAVGAQKSRRNSGTCSYRDFHLQGRSWHPQGTSHKGDDRRAAAIASRRYPRSR